MSAKDLEQRIDDMYQLVMKLIDSITAVAVKVEKLEKKIGTEDARK